MTKSAKPAIVVLAVLMVLVLGAELAIGWFAYSHLSKNADTLAELRDANTGLRSDLAGLQDNFSDLREDISTLAELADNSSDPGQEDDVRIAGEYMIRSTLPISDAYRSGDRSALSDKEKETLDMASAILAEIITPEMDNYQKEEAVYLWMTKNLTHDEGLLPVIPQTQADCDNPYGVLKYHNAVCVGYATTFRLFMQMLDIPCMVVHNSERYHSWDLVQLDGGWYHTDIYSDVGQSDYSHFNLTDTMHAINQSWNTDFFPAADQYEYCHAYLVSVEERDPYHIPASLRAAIDSRESVVSLRFPKADMDETGAQIVQQMLNDIDTRIYSSTLSNELYIGWNWLPLDDSWLLTINLCWYEEGGDEPEPTIPDEAYEKINGAVEDAFGDLEYQEGGPVYTEPVGWGTPKG
ncbi:MAG: hypothetical protein J5789_09880 [Oscillospiraceae bacterium]|nr:hypothetical protein [Oscillospiraceae bacterium]